MKMNLKRSLIMSIVMVTFLCCCGFGKLEPNIMGTPLIVADPVSDIIFKYHPSAVEYTSDAAYGVYNVSYDANGNAIAVSYAAFDKATGANYYATQCNLTYDANNRIVSTVGSTTNVEWGTTSLSTAYSYDNNGNLINMVEYENNDGYNVRYDNSYALSYTGGLLSGYVYSGTSSDGNVYASNISLSRDASGRIVSINFIGDTGKSFFYGFNDHDDVVLITAAYSSGEVYETNYSYVYDELGRPSAIYLDGALYYTIKY